MTPKKYDICEMISVLDLLVLKKRKEGKGEKKTETVTSLSL